MEKHSSTHNKKKATDVANIPKTSLAKTGKSKFCNYNQSHFLLKKIFLLLQKNNFLL